MHTSFNGYRQFLRRYLAQQRKAVLFMAVLLIISTALQLVAPQVVRSFVDKVRAGASEGRLVQLAFLFIGVSIAQQAMNVLTSYWSERVAWVATNALRADLTAHLLRLDPGFHKLRTPGELIERVDGDVSILAGFFSSFVVQLIGSLLLLIGVLVALSLVNVWLGLTFTIFTVLALTLLSTVRRFATPYWKKDRESSAAFYGYMSEVLAATEDLRSSGATAYALRRFFGHLRHWQPIKLRAELWGSAVWMIAVGIFAAGDAIAYGLGGGLYRNAAISLGAVYMVVAYIAMLAEPIETIRTQLTDLQRADVGLARVRELLETRSRLADGEEIVPSGPLTVEFREVTFRYEDLDPSTVDSQQNERVYLFEKVSFSLEAGRILGVVGRTGSGKTTIARLLFRLYDPQEGEVRLGGVDLRQAHMEKLRARIGLVTQDVQIFVASLRDNVTFFNPAITDDRLLEVFETLGLDTWLKRLPHGWDTLIAGSSLSGGEAQLLALARVFIKNPGLILLDEASSRLDPATEAQLEQALNTLLQDRSAIIIAHRLATVERADDILMLENGHILEYGPREQLAADPHSRFAQLRRSGMEEILQ